MGGKFHKEAEKWEDPSVTLIVLIARNRCWMTAAVCWRGNYPDLEINFNRNPDGRDLDLNWSAPGKIAATASFSPCCLEEEESPLGRLRLAGQDFR